MLGRIFGKSGVARSGDAKVHDAMPWQIEVA